MKFEPIIPQGKEVQPWLRRAFMELSNWAQYLISNLVNDEIPIGKTNLGEVHYTLIALVDAYNSASTTGDEIGGIFYFDPSAFPSGNWYLEATIAIANAASKTTLTLLPPGGGTEVGHIETQATALTRVRSTALTMPLAATQLLLSIKTSNASHDAYVVSAKLVYIP
jgi:hypothetical protein